VVRSTADGYVSTVDAYGIGVAAWRLGAGRARKEDPVSPGAGVLLHRRPGDSVRAGDPLFELRADDPRRIPDALALAREAVTISAVPPTTEPLVIERVG
jgi:thymidine phosphorylase